MHTRKGIATITLISTLLMFYYSLVILKVSEDLVINIEKLLTAILLMSTLLFALTIIIKSILNKNVDSSITSLNEKILNNSRIVRELTDAEKDQLTVKNSWLKGYYSYSWVMITIVFFFNLFLLYVFVIGSFAKSTGHSVIILALIYFEYRLFLLFQSVNNTYLDLRSPVFVVRSKIVEQNYLLFKRMIVGDTNFDAPNGIKSGELVEIEYSPYSKRIWKLKRLNN